jgi:putative DNA primase/helicase
MTLTPVLSSQIYRVALAALRAGISFLPILADGTKQPAVRWKRYQQQRPTRTAARKWFLQADHGIAFVTGQISGGLEMLDFDTLECYERFVARVQQEGLTVLLRRIERGYSERTPQGVHLYYRCAWIEGNQKLAQRPIEAPPHVLSLIETRGEGGYSIAAPSCGQVHPSGQPYRVMAGTLASIQTISVQARALLLSVARSFDEMPSDEETAPQKATRSSPIGRYSEGHRPGTIFNERATWPDILEPHGWTWVKRIGDEDFWRRPGKERGVSATTNYAGSDLLYVFSTSTVFEAGRGYSKFAAYTLLEHHGDFSQAARDLVAQGYIEEEDMSVPFISVPRSSPNQVQTGL